eukprot:scaffold842_cov112-Isochrysis_galbana.AAC.2
MPHTCSQRHPSLCAEDGGAAATFRHRQQRGQPLRTPPNRAPPPAAAPLRPRRASAARQPRYIAWPCSDPAATGTISSALEFWPWLPPPTAASRAADRSGAPKSAALTSSSAAAVTEVGSEPPPTIRSRPTATRAAATRPPAPLRSDWPLAFRAARAPAAFPESARRTPPTIWSAAAPAPPGVVFMNVHQPVHEQAAGHDQPPPPPLVVNQHKQAVHLAVFMIK